MRLDTAGTATFDATGRAVVRLTPVTANASWRVTRASVATTSTANTACNVYRSTESPSNLIDGTLFGNLNSDTNMDEQVLSGQAILFVWTGGTPGAYATATLNGDLNVV